MGRQTWPFDWREEEVGQPLPGVGRSSIAHETIKAVREISLIDDIITTREDTAVEPMAIDTEK